MCNYNGVRVSRAELLRLLEIERELRELQEWDMPAQTGFDYPEWPVVKPNAECGWELAKMEWGFLPWYVKNRDEATKFRNGWTDENGRPRKGTTTLNARSEELLLENKMFRNAALKRRCLVLSSGFYEWRHVYPLGKNGQPLKTAKKYPYHIRVKNKPVFLMAGVWTPWKDQDTGEYVHTFAVVTTKANSLMEQIHNSQKRMPTILNEQLAGEWISDGLSEERITQLATYQIPASEMEAHTIAKDFRDIANPTEPFKYAELPEVVLEEG